MFPEWLPAKVKAKSATVNGLNVVDWEQLLIFRVRPGGGCVKRDAVTDPWLPECPSSFPGPSKPTAAVAWVGNLSFGYF